jgi:hypothetical protein
VYLSGILSHRRGARWICNPSLMGRAAYDATESGGIKTAVQGVSLLQTTTKRWQSQSTENTGCSWSKRPGGAPLVAR